MTSIVCFGEILWDVLPSGKQPGGAPFNVAVHLHQLGQPVALISRVGHDDLGQELLDFLTARGLDTAHVQRGETHLTGVVKANVGDRNEVVYKIVQPVAWDYIQYDDALARLVAEADMFVFGSLAARQEGTRGTLYQLLEHARFRVFDVNLRAPHYTRETIEYLLAHADLVKVNEHELAEIMGWYGQPATEATALPWLAQRLGLQAVCVTLGADGAMLWKAGQTYRSPGLSSGSAGHHRQRRCLFGGAAGRLAGRRAPPGVPAPGLRHRGPSGHPPGGHPCHLARPGGRVRAGARGGVSRR